jgi:hypothetical protein
VDKETTKLLNTPRCGLPDVNQHKPSSISSKHPYKKTFKTHITFL